MESWNIERVCKTIARLAERMQGNVIWTSEITDNLEKNEYRLTNFQNIRENRGKQDEEYCSEFKIEDKRAEQRKLRRFVGLAEGKRCLLVANTLGAMLVTSATSHHKTQTHNSVVGRQYR